MSREGRLFRLLILLLYFLEWFFIISVRPVFSQQQCPGNGIVRVIEGATLTIRQNAGGNIPGNTVLGYLKFEDGERRTVEEKSGFVRLEVGGWIVANYLHIISCATPTPTATSTRIAPTPTRIIPTPTPIMSPTPKVVWICDRAHCSEFEIPYTVSEDARRP